MATPKTFDCFFAALIAGTHGAMNSAQYYVRLSNTAPNKATMDEIADVTAITGGSYADGEVTLDWTETPDGTFTLGDASSDVTFTADTTDFGEFRYAYLYNGTASGDPLIAVIDYGVGITVTAGNSFTVNAGSNGWLKYVTPSWT